MNHVTAPFLTLLPVLAATLLAAGTAPVAAQISDVHPVAIAVHGGAGTILPEHLSAEDEALYRERIEAALRAGHAVLLQGGSALDAVDAALRLLEDSPLFNAGKGAVLTAEGVAELDAAIMSGKDRSAGAVAGVHTAKHPISLARMVMERTPHVLLTGSGADAFAREQGAEEVPPEYFITPRRLEQFQRARERAAESSENRERSESGPGPDDDFKYGTVGAVALDRNGNLAAGTSTGGMTNKRPGRVGDSPLIGAGTYANNRTCAVSATGSGEYFIRGVLAHEVSSLMQFGGLSVEAAAAAVIHGTLPALGGDGGLIAMDGAGRVAMPFNTAGMYRGLIDTEGALLVKIFRDR